MIGTEKQYLTYVRHPFRLRRRGHPDSHLGGAFLLSPGVTFAIRSFAPLTLVDINDNTPTLNVSDGDRQSCMVQCYPHDNSRQLDHSPSAELATTRALYHHVYQTQRGP